MARVPVVTQDMVPEEFRDAFNELTRDTGGSITGGPGSITINSPEMSRRRSHLTAYLRFESTFPKRIQELAILATARAMDCPYIWNAHAPAARTEGVSDALVDALRDRKPLPGDGCRRTGCHQFLHRILREPSSVGVDLPGCAGAIRRAAPGGDYCAHGQLRPDRFFPERF